MDSALKSEIYIYVAKQQNRREQFCVNDDSCHCGLFIFCEQKSVLCPVYRFYI